MKKYITLLLAAFFVGITTNIGHPITPYYINQLQLDKIVFTYFFASMNFGMLLTAPFWGSLGDSKGRKKIIIICLIFYGIGQVFFGIFKTPFLITCARFFSGLFSGGILVSLLSYATRSEDLKKYNQTRLIGTFVSIQTVGVSVGSFIGGALGDLFKPHYNYVFYIQGILMALFAIYIIVFMSFSDEKKQAARTKNPFASFSNLKKVSIWFLVFLLTLVLINITFTDSSKYLDVYFSDCGYGSLSLGTVNLIVGLITLVINILLTPILIRKLRPLLTMTIFCFIGAICLALTFQVDNLLFGIYTFYMVYIISKAVIEPASVNFLSENKNIAPGIIMGLRQSFISLGSIIGILIGGIIYAYKGVALFYYCAIGLALAGIIILILLVALRKKISNT